MTIINSRYSDRRCDRKIRGLKRIFDQCEQERRPGKRRFAHRDFLEAVYALFAKIGAGVLGTEMAKRLAEIHDIAIREKEGLIRAIIDASASNLDPKMASRWTRALKFIWRERQHWTDWRAFVDSHDGIAGCAHAFSKARKDRRADVAQRANRDFIGAKKRSGLRRRLVLTDRVVGWGEIAFRCSADESAYPIQTAGKPGSAVSTALIKKDAFLNQKRVG